MTRRSDSLMDSSFNGFMVKLFVFCKQRGKNGGRKKNRELEGIFTSFLGFQ